MRTGYVVALAMLSGIGIGVASMHTLHAQAKPPVYMIGLVDISNPEGYAKEYVPPAQTSIKAHGGVQLAGGPGTMIEGLAPGSRFVVIRWDSLEQLKGWRYSPEYMAAHNIGEKYAKFTVAAVNGVVQ
jgi:uncharacterized protein (DUF1330 family)